MPPRSLLSGCFALSGAAALALEMLWMRSASLALGATAATTATVLAVYFAGLGLGAALGRGAAPHGVRRYGLLELGAAALALWSATLFSALGGETAQRWLAGAGQAGAVFAIALAALPAAICLGATLPTLGGALVAPGSAGWRGGLLYATNTAGGVLGIAAAGFGLPAWIGVSRSYALVAASSGLAGAVALAVSMQGRTPYDARAPGAPASDPTILDETASAAAAPRSAVHPSLASASGPLSRTRLRALAAAAGAIGLGLEVLWTRLFAQVLHNSVYSFAALSLAIVAALALGAAVAAPLVRRRDPGAVAAIALAGAAVATAGGVSLFVALTGGLGYVGMRSGLPEYVLRIVALAVATAGPAALASGVVLPSLWAAWRSAGSAAQPLGSLLAANTLGAIGGALAAAFVALPAFGLRGGFLAASIAYAGLAALAAPTRRSALVLTGTAALAIALASPLRAPLLHLRSERETVRAALEGPSGTVAVVAADGDLELRLDNFYVLGSSAAAEGERRQGLLPLLLHPAPERVAFIGLATGVTASAGPALGVNHTTAVELVPEVATAAREHFAAWNGRLAEQDGVRVAIGDGRRFLAATDERFDVIVADLFIPWHAGAGTLYARETFAAARRRLAPGGLFCQWLPLYQLTREEFEIVARTFAAVFPSTSLWRDDFHPDRPIVALVGRTDAAPIDLDDVGARVAALPEWARDRFLGEPAALAMLYAGDLSTMRSLGSGPLNTDDRPVVEFLAPRLTRVDATGDKDWLTGEALAALFDELTPPAGDERLPFLRADAATRDAVRAGRALYGYALAAVRGDAREANRLEAKVRELVPQVVAAADEAPRDARHEALQRLAHLQAEEQQSQIRLQAMEQRLQALQAEEGR